MKSLYSLPVSLMLCSALLVSSAHANAKQSVLPVDGKDQIAEQAKIPAENSLPLDLVYTVDASADEGNKTQDKLVETLKEASKSQGNLSRAASPKDNQISYHKDTDTFRAQVEGPAWQKAHSDRRSFAVFGRNYINRIHCDGVISDVIFPTTKGLELELKNGGRDLFVQVGPEVPADITYFPVDMYAICNNEVFQIAAVVDSKYPASNTELVLSGEIKPENLRGFENAIQKAQSLPHEEKIAKILKRVWNDDPLTYWSRKNINQTCKGMGSPCTLRQSLETGIDGMVAWDFVAPREATVHELLAGLSPHVSGQILGIGRVRLNEAQRVIILTNKQAATRK